MNLVRSCYIELQFYKQIIIARIKLDICIGYKPFISKAVENVESKLHINWLSWIKKGYHWQNLLRNVIACEFWCAYRVGGFFARWTTPGAWNVDALICNQHGAEIWKYTHCGTTWWQENLGIEKSDTNHRNNSPKMQFLDQCQCDVKLVQNIVEIWWSYDTYLNSSGWILSKIPKTNIHKFKSDICLQMPVTCF